MSSENVVNAGSFSTANIDKGRRRFLIATTSVVGAVGVVGLATPFISSMLPSAKAKAAGAPVEADISKLEPGQLVTYEWRGKPVWIVRRTDDALKSLSSVVDKLRDPESDESLQPEYTKNTWRSINTEYLVLIGVCTHLGCSPTYMPEIEGDWRGGFFCPCHGSKFDFAGRVYKGVPAPLNLEVPPHHFLSDNRILIGEDGVA